MILNVHIDQAMNDCRDENLCVNGEIISMFRSADIAMIRENKERLQENLLIMMEQKLECMKFDNRKKRDGNF